MKTPTRSLCILACSLTALLAPGTLPTADAASQDSAKTSSRVQQAALDILKRSSDSLAAAKAMTYETSSSVEMPAKYGQLVTLFADSRVIMQRPNKLRVSVSGEVPNFDFYYNGATLSAWAPENNVYSVCNAPATIDAMLPFLKARTGIRFPSAGVLFSDPYPVLTRTLTSGFVVGSAQVNGTPCDHLAFAGKGVNWEIWIEKDGSHLPRRLAVIYTDTASFPRFLIEFNHWNLHPWLCSSCFNFTPPAGAKQIDFLPVGKNAAAAKSAK